MLKIKLFILILLTQITLIQGANKHTLSGTITDSTTGESLIGASIRVKDDPNNGVTTNSYGYFSLTLPDGNYTFVISYLGFKTIEESIQLNINKQLQLKMSPDSRQLEDVEVTAMRKNNNIVSTDMGVERLEMKEIAKIPVIFGEADILKTLKLTPGIKSVGEGNGGFFVRGGNSSQNLILLDEATVYNADHLMGFFSTFNSDAIKDIQMFKGTAPAEYGGRISSVLDVKMNEGNNQDYHVGGGIGLISSRLNVQGPLMKDKSSFLITGRRTYADLFLKLSPDELINNNQLYFYDLNAKLNYILNDNNRLYISGYFGRDIFEFQERFGIDWGNRTGSVRWNHIWNEKMFSNLSVIYSDYSYKVNVKQDAGFSLKSIIETWNVKQDFQYYINNKNTLNFGLQISFHSITPGQLELSDNAEINPVKLQNRMANETGIFISNNWKPSYNLNIQYGIRLAAYNLTGAGDFYTYNNGEVMDTTHYKQGEIVQTYLFPEPRINIAWVLNDRNSLKAGYTRNTQNLHLISNSTASMPTDIWIPSSKLVKPEIGDQVSLGYFRNFNKDKYQLSIETYYRWMQNQIDLKNGANINANEHIEGELLFGQGRAYGIEFLLKKKYGKLNGWIGYTWSRTERLIDGINNNNWYPARQDITHDLSVVGIYDISKKWSVSATWVYNTGNAVTFPSGKYLINGQVEYYYTERNGYRMPAYHRMDIGATLQLKKTRQFESNLNFSVYNAYGQKNPFSIDFEQDEVNPAKTNAVMTYLFTYVPSVTYNFKF